MSDDSDGSPEYLFDNGDSDDVKNILSRKDEEILRLKKQFCEIQVLEQNLTEMSEKNNELKKFIGNITGEKIDCERRLSIIVDKMDSREKEFEQEKIEINARYQREMQSLKDKVEESNREREKLLNIYNKEKMEIRLQYEKKERDIVDKLGVLFSVSQKTFGVSFSSLESFITFIENYSINKADEPKQENQHKDIQIMISKLQDKKAKLEIENSALTNEIKSLKIEFGNRVDEFKTQISDKCQEMKRDKLTFQQETESLQSRIKMLESSNQNLKEKIDEYCQENQKQNVLLEDENAQLLESLSINAEVQNKYKRLNKKNKSMKQCIKEQVNEINELQQQIDEITIHSTQLNETINELRVSLSSKSEEALSYQSETTRKDKIIDELKQAVDDRNGIIEQLKREIKNHQENIVLLSNSLADHMEEIKGVQIIRKSLIDVLNKQESIIKKLENTLQQEHTESLMVKSRLTAEIESLKAVNIGEPQKISSILWQFSEFPSDLNIIISKISDNDSLQLQSKIQCIYGAIHSYYSEVPHDNDYDTTNDLYVDFLSRICNIFGLESEPNNLEKTIDYISNWISQQRENNKVLSNQLSIANQHLYDVINSLDSPNICSAVERIKELYSKIRSLESILTQNQKDKKKFHQQDQMWKEKICLFEEKITSIEKEKHQTISDLRLSLSEEKDNSHMKELQIQKLLNQIVLINHEWEEKCAILQQKTQNEVSVLSKSSKSEILTLQDQVAFFKNKLEKLQLALSRSSKKKKGLKRSIVDYMSQSQELEAIIEEQKMSAENSKRMVEELNQKLIKMQAEYEKDLNEKEKAIAMLRKELESANKQVKNGEVMISQFQKQVSLKKTLRESDESALETLQREKNIAIAKCRAELIAKESKLVSEIDELQAKFEVEKRGLFAYAASMFVDFYDARHQLKDETFKELLSKTKSELERLKKLESTIRSYMAIPKEQSVEDAVFSRLVLNKGRSILIE